MLVLAAGLLAWAILPTAPNYDTATHLVWAHEIADGRMPNVKAAFSPTLHPLWLVASFVAEDSGGGAALLQLVALCSLGFVVACSARLAADLGGWVAGLIAGAATGSSFALLLLAFKAYVDLPFLAVVLTAVVVERAWQPGEPRPTEGRWVALRGRGLTMPALMFCAGLLRPEAWALGLLMVALRLVPRVAGGAGGAGSREGGAGHGARNASLWPRFTPRAGARRASAGRGARNASLWPRFTPRAGAAELIVPAIVIIAAPIAWALFDQALTGDPVHSLTGTQALAEELSRTTGLTAAPKQLITLLSDLARPPIAAAGVLGVVLAMRLVGWRPLLIPMATLVASAAGFLLIGALGLPLLQRYLELPAVLLCSYAGVAGSIVIAAARGGANPKTGLAFASTGADVPLLAKKSDAASSLTPGVRWLAAAVLALGVVGAGGYVVLKAGSFRIVAQGVLREGRWQHEGAALVRTLHRQTPKTQCGPVSLPTYRFVPELTLAAGLDEGDVVSRATQLGGSGPQPRGIAITIAGTHAAKERLGWAQGVPRTTNAVPAGFTVVAHNGPFIAAARCP